jgi:hypothetical protein
MSTRRKQPPFIHDDPEIAARILRRRGYRPLCDRASGMHWQRRHVHVWLAPDGELYPLGETYAAARAAWSMLSEHSEVRA